MYGQGIDLIHFLLESHVSVKSLLLQVLSSRAGKGKFDNCKIVRIDV